MSLGKSFTQITRTIDILDDVGKKIGKSVVNIKDFGNRAVKTVTNVQKTSTGTLKTVNKTVLGVDKATKKKERKEKRKPTLGGFKDIIGLFLEPILRPLIKIFKPFGIIFDIFAAGLQQELLPIMKRIFALLTDPVIVEAIREIGRLVGTLFLPILEGVERFLTGIINNPEVLEDFMDVLRGVIGVLRSIIDIFTEAVFDALEIILQFFADNPTIIEDLIRGLQDVVDFILGIPQFFEDAGSAFYDLGEDVGGFMNQAGSAFYDLGQDIGAIGFGIGDFFNRLFGGPGLAEGGIVRRPTFSLIGEAGPEAVIPLDRVDRREDEFGFGFGGGNGRPITIVVNGITDIPRLARVIRDEVEFL